MFFGNCYLTAQWYDITGQRIWRYQRSASLASNKASGVVNESCLCMRWGSEIADLRSVFCSDSLKNWSGKHGILDMKCTEPWSSFGHRIWGRKRSCGRLNKECYCTKPRRSKKSLVGFHMARDLSRLRRSRSKKARSLSKRSTCSKTIPSPKTRGLLRW